MTESSPDQPSTSESSLDPASGDVGSTGLDPQTGKVGARDIARARLGERWRAAWPIVLLVLASGLLLTGGAYAVLTKPQRSYQPYLERAERLIAAESYAEAIDLLNTEVFAYSGDSALSRTQAGRARVLAGRAIFLGQRALGVDLVANHQNVVAEYLAGEELGSTLEGVDNAYLAQSFVAMSRYDQAAVRAGDLPSELAAMRADIYRSLVDAELDRPSPDFEQALQWAATVMQDASLTVDDRVWAAATRARIRYMQGFIEEGVERLVQALVRYEGQGASRQQLAELYLQLGEGYRQLGDDASARRQFERAVESFGVGEPQRGRGELHLAALEPEVERRRDLYQAVVESYASTALVDPALLGLAATLAEMGELPEANARYDELIGRVLEGGSAASAPGSRGVGVPVADAETVAASLLEVHRRLMDSGDTAAALEFGAKIERLFSFAELPDEALTELARANRLLADEMLPDGGEVGLSWTDLQEVDPATRSEAQARLLRAARYYAEYARRVVLTSNEEYAASLWNAARAYDLGGDIRRAMAAYQEYSTGFPDDAKRFEAAYRLAQAYQVTGQYASAARLYEELIDGPQVDSEDRAAVLFGEASYVPLAQTLLLDDDETNDERAEELLRRVVSGAVVQPGARLFKDALWELARLYFAQGRHARAVERLDEALARFPDDAQAPLGLYRLAEAHRRLGGDLRQALAAGGRPESEMQAMRAQLESSLGSALMHFDEAIDALDAIDPRRRTDLEDLSLRNAFFYRGDCAFDLGEYDAAIRYYDEARERYSGEPASLVALVQIVNAHVALGDLERARTANARAKRFFESLPPEVWDDPYLPMDRSEWERWLESTDVLYRRVEAGP